MPYYVAGHESGVVPPVAAAARAVAQRLAFLLPGSLQPLVSPRPRARPVTATLPRPVASVTSITPAGFARDAPGHGRAEWQGGPCLASPSVALTTTSSTKMASWSTARAETRRAGPLSARRAHTDRRKEGDCCDMGTLRCAWRWPSLVSALDWETRIVCGGAGSEHPKRIAGGAAAPRAGPDGGRRSRACGTGSRSRARSPRGPGGQPAGRIAGALPSAVGSDSLADLYKVMSSLQSYVAL
jgi:hypothetical protein